MQCGGTSGAKPATEEINEITNKVDLVFHYWHKGSLDYIINVRRKWESVFMLQVNRLLIEIKEGFLKF